MFERFTDRSRKVMALANQEAQRFNHEYIGTEHILLGLAKEGSGVGANVLKNLDIDLRKIRLEVEKIVKPGPETVTMGKLPQTPRAKKVIEYAIDEARSLNHNYVGTEHLLLGLCRESDGVAGDVLRNLEVSVEEVRAEVEALLGEEKETVSRPDKIQDGELISPFSFRYRTNDKRIELLGPTGDVLDSKTFSGPIGEYVFNAVKKHETSQKLFREILSQVLKDQKFGPFHSLISRIERIIDSY